MNLRAWPVKLRMLAGVLVALTLGASLSACRTNVGAAAFIGGQRISESDLQKYVQAGATPFSVQNQDGSSGTIVPRSYVLQQLITMRILETALRRNGGAATSEELSKARPQVVGTAGDAELQKELSQRGFDSSFEPVLIRSLSLIVIGRTRLGTDKLATAIKNADVPVKVNPRYGSWNASQLSLDSNPATPDFIAPSPTQSAAPLGG